MINVVLAKPKDVKRLTEIFKQAALHKHSYNDHSWQDGFSEEGAKWMVKRGETYVVYLDKQLVATVGLEWEDDGWDDNSERSAGYIHRLAVADGSHGINLGRQIISWATKQVIARGRESLRLDCSLNNTSLCAYYESQGFKQVTTKVFPEYDNYTAVLYQKPV